jgi:hypothetical protein
MTALDPREATAWLIQHIPFRVTAGIAGTPICDEWANNEPPLRLPIGLRYVCLNDATFQGRMAACRWLVEFVGLQERGDPNLGPQPCPSRAAASVVSGKTTTDFGLGMLPGGSFILPQHSDAKLLARTWKGCAQATSHPTAGTNHPDVSHEILTKVMRIVITHLDQTAYKHAHLTVRDAVLNQTKRFTR